MSETSSEASSAAAGGRAPEPQHRRVVLKVGTNLLTGGGERLDRAIMSVIADQIAEALEGGCELILVTSGAIAAGRDRLAATRARRAGDAAAELPHYLTRRQVLAAIGQGPLLSLWDELLAARSVTIAQALLGGSDLADRQGYLNARNTLLALLDLGVVPIVNENDVVSVEEIQDATIGDNDSLSAHVANLVDADLLLMLTDIAGLYTADPGLDASARLIERVDHIGAAIEALARGPGKRGRGGMRTKVEAARLATQSGAHAVIADGRRAHVVRDAIQGASVGTWFAPTTDRLESRRRYLLSPMHVQGTITIDQGAVRALVRHGRSLLPAGVVATSGDFERGHVVRIESSEGAHIASGRANYGAEDLGRISGEHSDRIEELLGHDYGDEAVHRNNLVLV